MGNNLKFMKKIFHKRDFLFVRIVSIPYITKGWGTFDTYTPHVV